MNRNFKIGLALGSGAARGLAHIGVLETLKKYEIPIDMISGSSAGALIGSMFCCDLDFKYVKILCKKLNQRDYMDIGVPRTGLIRGNKIQEILKLVTKDCDFKDLIIPLQVVATDLKNKKLKVLNEGKVYEAVRASISIPGVFMPYFKDDMTLVDGAVLERVPAKILKESGMDLVIGVDVGFNMTTSNCKSIFHVLFEVMDLMSNELFMLKKQEADIMIRVDMNDFDPTRFDLVDLCVERGAAAAEKAMPDILKRIEELKNKEKEQSGELNDKVI
jgi:NTE family protein